jgi:hypothetical protein
VLDTATDVARAMLHLHSQNVLHSDLKVGVAVGGLADAISLPVASPDMLNMAQFTCLHPPCVLTRAPFPRHLVPCTCQARNVLLKQDGSEGRRAIAKGG